MLFWIVALTYLTVCEIYTALFLANVLATDSAQWLESTAMTLAEAGHRVLEPVSQLLSKAYTMLYTCFSSKISKLDVKRALETLGLYSRIARSSFHAGLVAEASLARGDPGLCGVLGVGMPSQHEEAGAT